MTCQKCAFLNDNAQVNCVNCGKELLATEAQPNPEPVPAEPAPSNEVPAEATPPAEPVAPVPAEPVAETPSVPIPPEPVAPVAQEPVQPLDTSPADALGSAPAPAPASPVAPLSDFGGAPAPKSSNIAPILVVLVLIVAIVMGAMWFLNRDDNGYVSPPPIVDDNGDEEEPNGDEPTTAPPNEEDEDNPTQFECPTEGDFTNHELIGVWEWDLLASYTYIFCVDGTGFRGDGATTSDTFTWSVPEAGFLKMYVNDLPFSEDWDFTIEDDVLTIESRQLSTLTFSYTRRN